MTSVRKALDTGDVTFCLALGGEGDEYVRDVIVDPATGAATIMGVTNSPHLTFGDKHAMRTESASKDDLGGAVQLDPRLTPGLRR